MTEHDHRCNRSHKWRHLRVGTYFAYSFLSFGQASIFSHILQSLRIAVVRHVQFLWLEKLVLQIVLIIGAVLFCLALQALDDFLSQFGVVSVAHGVLLGYAQVFASKTILEWGGYKLGWFVVILIVVCALAVSVYKIRNTGTRWVFAFNSGILSGIIYGGYDLI